jgi:hypothetical protein
MAKRKNLKGGKIYFDSWLQGFQFTVGQLHCFRPQVRQNIVEERVRWSRATHHLVAGCKGRQEEEARDKISFKGMPPVTTSSS